MMTTSPASQASKTFVVLNPVAGNADAETIHQALERQFGNRNQPYEVYQTTGQERLGEVVHAALDRSFDMVLAVGGDGTISGVTDGMAHTAVPMGIIPTGTMNTLARDLGIPLTLNGAMDLASGHHAIKTIDTIQVEDRFYVLNVSTGVSSLTMGHTKRREKRRFGFAAYIWKGARWLSGFQPVRFTVVVDGQPHQPRASEVVIANSSLIGMPPFRWGMHVCLDDGQLDACIVRARSAPDYLRLAWNILLGRQKHDPGIRYLSVEHSITIDANRRLPVQGDGDIIGHTPVQVQVVPQALRVIVPANIEHGRT
jgi:diacylglycerol kinase (ATP)